MLDNPIECQRKFLKIFQANFARKHVNHDLTLALERDECVDDIISQKSWIVLDSGKKFNKTHVDYDIFSPTGY